MLAKPMKFSDSCRRLGAAIGLGTGLAALSGAAFALPVPWQLNMTEGVTKTSHEVYQMHMWALWVCVVNSPGTACRARLVPSSRSGSR